MIYHAASTFKLPRCSCFIFVSYRQLCMRFTSELRLPAEKLSTSGNRFPPASGSWSWKSKQTGPQSSYDEVHQIVDNLSGRLKAKAFDSRSFVSGGRPNSGGLDMHFWGLLKRMKQPYNAYIIFSGKLDSNHVVKICGALVPGCLICAL